MASFVSSPAVAGAGSGKTLGVILLPNSGARVRVAPFSAVSFPASPRGVRGWLVPMVPEGTKGLFLESATNFRCNLVVSEDANALRPLPLAVPEGTKGLFSAPEACGYSDPKISSALGLLALPVPEGTEALLRSTEASFCGSGDPQISSAFGLLALPMPEGTEAPLPSTEPIFYCSGDPQVSTAFGLLAVPVPEGTKGLFSAPEACGYSDPKILSALGLLALPVPEGTEALLRSTEASFCGSGDPQISSAFGLLALPVPEGTEAPLPSTEPIFYCSGDPQVSTAFGLLAVPVPESTKALFPAPASNGQFSRNYECSKVGRGLLQVTKLPLPVVRCTARPSGFTAVGITGGRSRLSISAPTEVCWGLVPAANCHFTTVRCLAGTNPLGGADSIDNIPRPFNSTALVGYADILKDVAESSEAIASVIKEFTPLLVEFLAKQVLMEYLPMATVSVGSGNQKMDILPFIERRSFDIKMALQMAEGESKEGYIREETLVRAIVEVREPASRFLRSPRFGRAFELLPKPYAGTAAMGDDKVAHFQRLSSELQLIAVALNVALREVLDD